MRVSSFWFVMQLIVASILIFFISGRLIGSNVHLTKRILSVILSVMFTTFVFWYTYLRHEPLYKSAGFVDQVANVATLLWFGSTLLISMLLYLFFELFDPLAINENGERIKERTNIFKWIWVHWRRQKRLRQVVSVAAKNGITRTMHYVRHREDIRELAVAFRLTLEECGGIFIKFGQVLSTRKELFPPVFIEELEKLQQNVPPISPEQVQNVLNTHLKQPIDEVFSYFSETPLAAASIGQVHKAILKETNTPVVVKILRPDVKQIMKDDVGILVEFANWISNRSAWVESFGFKDLAIGFAMALREEIDFEIEARNNLQIHKMMQQSKLKVGVPIVYTEYSSSDILVMEYLDGVSVAQADTLFEELTIDRNECAKTLLYSFLEQALESGIFHADPHPGNIYLHRHTGVMTMLDFGAVGRLADSQQEGLKLFLLSIQQNDVSLLYDGIQLLVENSSSAERAEVEQALSQVLLKISYIDKVPTDELIYSIFSIVREFELQFYPAVSVALRALVTIDGTLRVIDSEFDIFNESKDFSQSYLKESLKQPFTEPRKTLNKLEEELALVLPNLRKIPRRIDRLFQKVESGKIILHHDIFSDKANASFISQMFAQFILLMVGITFGIISVALLAISQMMLSAYAVYLNTAAYLGLFLCAILLVRLSIQAIRNMKKL